MKTAALYARVSSDRQKEQHTMASQTAALREYAQAHEYTIGPEWIFEDDGYSGSVLARPGLERLRDLAAEGLIETVLVYSPDRLSRNYAHQVLLLEELARGGAQVVFLKAPATDSPENRLLVQFQSVIAEYERAQIAERCRRGKRYQAKAGSVSVLAPVAPYGYRYVRKTQWAKAYYEVVASEAAVVRQVFELYTTQNRSLRSIARRLHEQHIPTRKKSVWQATTLWGMLQNPAYEGRAAFGRTEKGPPSPRRTRVRRLKGLYAAHHPVKRRRPMPEWIVVPVPALVSRETFALAQERLALNKRFSARQTRTPSVLQGLLVCGQCGYALYRIGARCASKHYRYYRCLGSDQRRPHGRICQAPGVRVDQLDALVWDQVWQLLNQPQLIEGEIQRRLEQCRQSSPTEQRQETLRREIARLEQQTDKLIDAYQEELITLQELRGRVPEIKKRQSALERELQSLKLQSVERERLAEMNASIARFTEQLRNSGQHLDVLDKQRIVRLLVREVVVHPDHITINHSIPLPGATGSGGGGLIDSVRGVTPLQPA